MKKLLILCMICVGVSGVMTFLGNDPKGWSAGFLILSFLTIAVAIGLNKQKNKKPKTYEEIGEIILPNKHEKIEQLSNKLNEYKARTECDSFSILDSMSAGIKIFLFKEILVNGFVNVEKLRQKLINDKHIPSKDGLLNQFYKEGCEVLYDYINNDGKNITGGMGLKKVS